MITWIIDNFVLVKDEKMKPYWNLWASLSLLTMWMFLWWSVGAWPTSVFGEGFARTEDVKGIKVQLLDDGLLATRVAQCQAPNDRVRQFYASRLSRLQREYHELTKSEFTLPPCPELVGPQ